MVARFLLLLFVFLAAQSAAAQPPRVFLRSHDLSKPVVRVLHDRWAAQQSYGQGSGVLVARCDLLLTARHVVYDPLRKRLGKSVSVYSPQLYGQSVRAMDDPQMAQFQPEPRPSANIDNDIALLRLESCPTTHHVKLEQISPMKFEDLPTLVGVGFPCDSKHRRAPEHIAMFGHLNPTGPDVNLSTSIWLKPGARHGQSGGPVFSRDRSAAPNLHMIMVAVLRETTAPAGCSLSEETGEARPGLATFAALLTEDMIAKIAGAANYLSAISTDAPN